MVDDSLVLRHQRTVVRYYLLLCVKESGAAVHVRPDSAHLLTAAWHRCVFFFLQCPALPPLSPNNLINKVLLHIVSTMYHTFLKQWTYV
jgi:hypothetical protein